MLSHFSLINTDMVFRTSFRFSLETGISDSFLSLSKTLLLSVNILSNISTYWGSFPRDFSSHEHNSLYIDASFEAESDTYCSLSECNMISTLGTENASWRASHRLANSWCDSLFARDSSIALTSQNFLTLSISTVDLILRKASMTSFHSSEESSSLLISICVRKFFPNSSRRARSVTISPYPIWSNTNPYKSPPEFSRRCISISEQNDAEEISSLSPILFSPESPLNSVITLQPKSEVLICPKPKFK